MRTLTLLLFMLTATVCLAQGDVYSPTRTVPVLQEKGGLSSDKRDKLRFMVMGGAVNPSFFLTYGEKFGVLSRAQFEVIEEITDTQTKTVGRPTRVIYSCAFVKALEGQHKDKEGWVVLKREVKDRYTDEYARPWVEED